MGNAKKRQLGIIVALVAGLALGGGGVFLATRGHSHAPGGEAAASPKYHCPMHPTYTSDKPGECPICGMKLVPIEGDAGGTTSGGKRKIAFYRSPMNPSQTSPVARKDEMGMDYVPVYEDEVSGGGEAVSGLATVTIDNQRQQLIGMRTAAVTVGPVGTGWRTVGRVAVDETRVRRVNVKVDGYVEKLFVDYTGKAVRKGEPLLSIYSPALLSAQSEYLLAVQTRDRLRQGGQSSVGEELVTAARRRLELWDIPRSEIAHLEHGGEPLRTLTLYSPISGVVTVKNVVQGSKLAAGDMPFEITDLSEVWVLADAYETDFRRVRVGLPASFKLDAFPGRKFQGRVTFIQPVLDPATRTAKLRLTFANPRGELRPDMFGEVSFEAKPHDGLRAPFDAVIDSGQQKVVFVALGEGRFQPRAIETGAQSSDWVEVTSGLKPGEQVVVRANFLIDSESRLKAALAALAKPAQAAVPAAPQQPAVPAGKTPPPASPHAGHGK